MALSLSRIGRGMALPAFMLASALALNGCGGGGDDEADGYTIANNHASGEHRLFITRADLDSTTDRVFDITGDSVTHGHTVTFTVAQLQQVKNGTLISSFSTRAPGDGHDHQVTVFFVR